MLISIHNSINIHKLSITSNNIINIHKLSITASLSLITPSTLSDGSRVSGQCSALTALTLATEKCQLEYTTLNFALLSMYCLYAITKENERTLPLTPFDRSCTINISSKCKRESPRSLRDGERRFAISSLEIPEGRP